MIVAAMIRRLAEVFEQIGEDFEGMMCAAAALKRQAYEIREAGVWNS